MTKKNSQNKLIKTEAELMASKKLGKKIFLYSIAALLISIIITFFDHALTIIFLASAISSIIGVSLWVETPHYSNNDNLSNSDISISGSHRMNNIHNMNNPANPLSYHHRNS